MVPQHSQDGTMSRADFDNLQTNSTNNSITLNNISTAVQIQNSNMHLQQQQSSTVFGSQLVDKNSITPYTDATQVSVI